MSLQMDLSESGLLMFFKPYQLQIMEALWASSDPLNSRQCWEAIDKDRSRASVINFLESAHKQGLLDKHEITGKGGHRGMYTPTYDKQGTIKFFKKIFGDRLNEL